MIGIKKRFQVAKCKTSLKLATARIKLMRNKKGAQVIQMKKELAQLLASGDDRTARIRVEHVIREEKMMGAYDLIEIYCELIVARLPIIESQKTCPIDLKEAIASVIFATPRCSDITELVDVKKNFRAKYGKEFVQAATEMHPNCGVSRMLVEKLSAVAPNIQTKVKVLSDIAQEHNVDWEATSFEESKPRDDLLNGPKNFEQANPITVDPPKIQTSDVPADFFQLNKKLTSDSQKNVTPADTSSQQSPYASTSHSDAIPTGMESGSMKKNQSLRSNSNNSNHSSDRDNGNMEFKDATSAAHAAAEAAERASFAARAAAQLAREGSPTQQYPTESHGSFNNRKPQIQNQQLRQNESNSSPKVTKSSSGSRSRNDSDESSVTYDNHKEDRYFRRHEDQGPSPQKSSRKESEAHFKRGDSGSSKSRSHSYSDARRYDETDFDDDDYQGSSTKKSKDQFRRHEDQGSSPRKSSKNDESEARFKRGESGSSKSRSHSYSDARRYDETEFDDDVDQGSSIPEVSSTQKSKDQFRRRPSPRKSSVNEYEARFKRGDSGSSKSRSHSYSDARGYDETNFDDDDDQGSSTPEISSTKKSKDQFTGVKKKSSMPSSSRSQKETVRETKKTSSFNGARRDDESESDDDDYDGPRFDAGFDHVELEVAGKSFFPSPDKEEDSHVWSPIKNASNIKDRVKPAKSVDHSVTSNLSDGPDSGSESETVKSGFSGSYKFDSPRKYPSHTKITSPSSKKPVEESQSPVKVDSRPNRTNKKKPSVYKTSSEPDSDDNDDKFPVKPSRSPFARPNTYFSYDGNDSDEEVSPSKHKPPSKAHSGPHGVSRRTKDQVEPKDKSEFKPKQSRTEPAEDLKKHHTTRPKQEPPKRIPEPKVSKPEVSAPPVEVANVKKPSHVHPKLPDFEDLADRIYAINKMERK